MPILIQELRLSLVWTKVFFADTNLPSLADPVRYQDLFAHARQSAPGTAPVWQLPWLPGRRQHFWEYYLKAVAPGNFESITAADARSYFVPLRLPSFCEATARDKTVATLEGFCFPHSCGVAATIRLRPEHPLPLADMVDAAIAARRADYNLKWKDSIANPHGNLQALADHVVARIHALAEIDEAAQGVALPYPITIATVIDAEGEQDSDEGLLNRALYALCTLRPGWKTGSIGQVSQPGQVAQPAPVLVGSADAGTDQLLPYDMGRAIWRPEHFSAYETKGRRTSLGCYHRNLTLATLQTSALTALMGRAEDLLKTPNPHFFRLSRNEVAQAITVLKNLEKGDYSLYRSWSLKHQISYYTDRMTALSQNLGL